MNYNDTKKIRDAARWLSCQSVSSNSDSLSTVTKADLEKLRDNIVAALLMIADSIE